jgi:glutamate 5-kinase
MKMETIKARKARKAMTPTRAIDNARRIVIKIGSALVTDEKSGTVREDWLATLAADIAALKNKEIIIVSSGAIALGRKSMGIAWTDRPSSIPLELKQAAAASGQVILSKTYEDVFAREGIKTALILLTPRDTEDRRSHLNARATINALLERGIIPVINENDTVSTTEIRFGDNDRLAARVAQMAGADLLIQLSTTDGLYTADPRVDPSATHIPLVERLDDSHFGMAGDALPGLSTGGMKSKLEAARLCIGAGVHMMIARGTDNHPLSTIERATVFKAAEGHGNARKRWIQTHVKPTGTLTIDDGAAKALQGGKSLLPAGVKKVEGSFERGDAVVIIDMNGRRLGIGLSAYNAADAAKIAGHKSTDIPDMLGYARGDALIHRDDMALQG